MIKYRAIHTLYVNVSLLDLILYCSYIRYSHWGKLSEEYMGFFILSLQLLMNL